MDNVYKLTMACGYFGRHMQVWKQKIFGEEEEVDFQSDEYVFGLLDDSAYVMAALEIYNPRRRGYAQAWGEAVADFLENLMLCLDDGRNMGLQRRRHVEVLLERLTGQRVTLPRQMTVTRFMQLFGTCEVVFMRKGRNKFRRMTFERYFRCSLEHMEAAHQRAILLAEVKMRDRDGVTIH